MSDTNQAQAPAADDLPDDLTDERVRDVPPADEPDAVEGQLPRARTPVETESEAGRSRHRSPG